MTKLTSLLKNEKLILSVVSWILFLSCSIGLCRMSYECIKQYLDLPQGVDVTYHSQDKIEFPAFNFCSDNQYKTQTSPLPLKNDVIRDCGLEMKDMATNFIGNGSKDCQDPEIFWEKASLKLADLGIKEIFIQYEDGSNTNIPILDNASKVWTKMHSLEFGTCFTLSLSKDLRLKNIWFIGVTIGKGNSLFVVVHQNTMLNPLNIWTTKEFIPVHITGNKFFSHFISYEQRLILDQQDAPCQSGTNYSFTKCILEDLKEVIF